jgi:hypothetical protein
MSPTAKLSSVFFPFLFNLYYDSILDEFESAVTQEIKSPLHVQSMKQMQILKLVRESTISVSGLRELCHCHTMLPQ